MNQSESVDSASMTSSLTLSSKGFIQNVYVWEQEIKLGFSSNTLNSSYLGPSNLPQSANISHDEHQLSGSDRAKVEPGRRKGHTKSRRGCYNCKSRRVKVQLTPFHKTDGLRRITVSRESSNVYSMFQTFPRMQMARNSHNSSRRSCENEPKNTSAGRVSNPGIQYARFQAVPPLHPRRLSYH